MKKGFRNVMRKAKIWILLVFAISLTACGLQEKDLQDNTVADTQEIVSTEDEAEADKKEEEKTNWEINRYVLKSDIVSYMDEEDEANYHELLDAVFAQEENVTVSDDYDRTLTALTAFQFGPYKFLVKDSLFSDDYTTLHLTYEYFKEEQDEICAYIDSEYEEILGNIISEEMNELDKLLAIYQYFAARISYDYEWLETKNETENVWEIRDIEIYDALKNNKGVCHSYVYLCEFALRQFDVECLRVDGAMLDTENESHMWFLARLDGKFYHFDPTWDSTEAIDGGIGLRYFGMTDEERLAGGIELPIVDENYGEVVCDSTRFANLRDVVRYEYVANHKWKMWRIGEENPVIYDTTSGEFE